MPGYRFSLAVLIGSEPYGLGFFGCFAELFYELFLIVGDFVLGSESIVYVYAEIFLFQVAYMAVARQYFPRNFSMVLAFAGDSTITRFFSMIVLYMYERPPRVPACCTERWRLPLSSVLQQFQATKL